MTSLVDSVRFWFGGDNSSRGAAEGPSEGPMTPVDDDSDLNLKTTGFLAAALSDMERFVVAGHQTRREAPEAR
ncbi:hypothetical protein B296_00030371 [Ensete ventricosum]|uniref:Uncharacterized protein n=1 Tax=Ensete ventricosum TaxID=4639 RepID=A0A426XI55_ENSVE|nr:hypothetical protein B296_00030371 [Ensete ventricosum]